MSKRMSIVYILLTFLGTLPAFAVDGITLINQSTVMAAGGFPFSILQPGSYKLSGSLQVPAETTGIQIFASGVTLDLNGFSLTGQSRARFRIVRRTKVSLLASFTGCHGR